MLSDKSNPSDRLREQLNQAMDHAVDWTLRSIGTMSYSMAKHRNYARMSVVARRNKAPHISFGLPQLT